MKKTLILSIFCVFLASCSKDNSSTTSLTNENLVGVYNCLIDNPGVDIYNGSLTIYTEFDKYYMKYSLKQSTWSQGYSSQISINPSGGGNFTFESTDGAGLTFKGDGKMYSSNSIIVNIKEYYGATLYTSLRITGSK